MSTGDMTLDNGALLTSEELDSARPNADRTPEGQLTNCIPPGGGEVVAPTEPTAAPPEVPTVEAARLVGKTKTIIDSSNYQSPLELGDRGFDLEFLQGKFQAVLPTEHLDPNSVFFGKTWLYAADSGMDRLRYTLYKYWTSLEYMMENSLRQINGEFIYLGSLNFESRIPVSTSATPPTLLDPDNNRILNRHFKKQTFFIQKKEEHFGGSSGTQDFVEFVNIAGQSNEFPAMFETGRVFFDHSHKIETPFSQKELSNLDSINKPVIESNSSEYNFYIKTYEDALEKVRNANMGIEEILPNLYISLAEKNSDNLDSQNSLYNAHITLQGLVDDVYTDVLNERGEKIGERDNGQYFEKWSEAFNKLLMTRPTVRNLYLEFLDLERYKNLIIPPQEISLMKSNNQKRFLFPMYVDIEFTTDSETQIAEALKQSELAAGLIRAATDSQFFSETSNFHIYGETVYLDPISTEESQRDVFIARELIEDQPRPLIDLLEWWEQYSEPGSTNSIYEGDNFVTIATNENELFQTEGENNAFARMIQSLIFSGRLEDICRDKFRSFREVLDGKLAMSETLFYRISKYDGDVGLIEPDAVTDPLQSGENSILGEAVPIQSFFIANSSDLDIARYIDTQIIYNKQYTYGVFAYELVFGTEYEYENPRIFNDSTVAVDVLTRPSLKLIEVPYYDFKTIVVDDPPMPPDVTIVPFKDINNKLLFNFEKNTGTIIAEPVIFNDDDLLAAEKIVARQKLQNGRTIRYTGDDEVDYYEIYKTTDKPLSYSDFSDSLYQIVDSEFYGTSSPRSSSTSFVDQKISPNLIYYYTFRSVDIHGNRSNPSAIYQVEIIDDGGVIYPIIEIFKFEKPDPAPTSKTFKRYLKIEPNFEQSMINITNEQEVDSARNAIVKLGNLDESLFSPDTQSPKKFKFRIISKETGQKVDINVVFKHKHTQDTDA